MSDKYKLLLVDDDIEWGLTFQSELSRHGFEIIFETEAEKALKKIHSVTPDAVLLDIMWPEEKGGHVNKGKPTLAKLKRKRPDLPVIMLTNTMASDYNNTDYPGASFPYGKDSFEMGDKKAYTRFAELIKQEIEKAGKSVPASEKYGFIVGKTAAMKEVCKKIDVAVKTVEPVLITGETGTGKELVAKAIHKLSARKERPFLSLNCGALTETLLESEIFGHEKSAFTGADKQRRGLFETAEGGSIFLDEIGEASRNVQVKLLRVLQEKEILRVGSSEPIKIDVKVIAATNKVLDAEVKKGKFREDLLYRLKVLEIEMPPLRERKEDIEELVEHFIKKFNEKHEDSHKTHKLRADVLAELKNHNWPGNIRELEKTIYSAALNTKSNWLLSSDFSFAQDRDNYPNLLGNDDNDLVSKFWAREIKLNDLGDYNKQRGLKQIVIKLIERWLNEKHVRPKSKELGDCMGTTDDIMRQILNKCGIKLTQFPKEKGL